MMILHFSHTMPAQNSSEGFDNLNSVRLEGYSVKNVAFYNYSHCRILKKKINIGLLRFNGAKGDHCEYASNAVVP